MLINFSEVSMNNIISNIMQKVLPIVLMLSINLTSLFAQTNPKLQVIVMFEKNIITLPQGKTFKVFLPAAN